MGGHLQSGLLVLLALLLALPPMAAQSADAGPGTKEVRLDDPQGDVQVVLPSGNQTAPSQYDYLDLRSVWMNNETLPMLEVGVALKRLDQPSDTPLVPYTSRDLQIHFYLEKVHFVVQPFVRSTLGCPEGAYLSRRVHETSSSDSGSTTCVKMITDRATNTIHFLLPRTAIRNATNVVFGPDMPLHHLSAVASASNVADLFLSAVGVNAAPRIEDRVPNTGAAPEFRSTIGEGFTAGHLRLSVREAVRVSNGESTTFVYPVRLSNNASTSTTAVLSVDNPQSSWTIRVPARLEVPAGKTIEFPVILSMGFDHRHGEIAYFRVRADDANDPGSHSILNLGVFWTDVPQPAGHHNKVWFHTGPETLYPLIGFPVLPAVCDFRPFWFNPLQKDTDPSATDEGVPPCTWDTTYAVYRPSDVTTNTVHWYAAMKPSLLIGLDFDVNQTGQLEATFKSPIQAGQSFVTATLYYQDPTRRPKGCDSCDGASVPIADGKSQPISLPGGGPTTFEVPLAFRPQADLLPYRQDANLALVVNLTTANPNHVPNLSTKDTAPLFLPTLSEMTLPLVEYHDPVDQVFQAVGSLALAPTGPFERPANPGSTISFPFRLTNNGTRDQDVLLQVEGENRDWAHYVEGETVGARAGSSRNVSLVVHVPDDAAPGERAELFAVAQSRADPNVVALARLRASVVDVNVLKVPDDQIGEAAQSGHRVPGLSIVATLTVLAIAGRRLRADR